MTSIPSKCLLSLLLLTAFIGCTSKEPANPAAEIAVTSTYLQSAILDIYPDANILCIASPGMCPGHFDLKPSQINQLRTSKALLLFDFQKSLLDQLKRVEADGLQCLTVTGRSGLCVPSTYLATCEEVAKQLTSIYPAHSNEFQKNLAMLRQRLAEFNPQTSPSFRPFTDTPVVCSQHQADFARWLGLRVVAEFHPSDAVTPPQIERCIQKARTQNAKLIIANQQEGTDLALSMAKRLNIQVAVFSNFPRISDPQNNFETLVRNNVKNLKKALNPEIPDHASP
ncbi:ABC-type Zn2+ transport system, periplasmic component/surface adhesin [Anaerohalosphaera lusitana]|uniref:ABC-type Zn2+ transport system, periplasmic component/surface adhesin n=1 Tax=Anaerohalosphaera lusitana TaxID=1936003 RepID=A0A1U9NPA2_9BACT|nr:metal ABC transporter substrate-binding protein [Anaerohalosphaera lusitana]AQT69751.1 ABC-type Zn2+ transport system, periplasmic component/surface adhesin [Anaerohalosphaera lusitana]